MAYFQTPNHKLGKFWRVLQRKMLAYFSVIWSISLPFGIFYVNLEMLWLFGMFLPFWYVLQRKIWQPCPEVERNEIEN
jgi:hypothetical protein